MENKVYGGLCVSSERKSNCTEIFPSSKKKTEYTKVTKSSPKHIYEDLLMIRQHAPKANCLLRLFPPPNSYTSNQTTINSSKRETIKT